MAENIIFTIIKGVETASMVKNISSKVLVFMLKNTIISINNSMDYLENNKKQLSLDHLIDLDLVFKLKIINGLIDMCNEKYLEEENLICDVLKYCLDSLCEILTNIDDKLNIIKNKINNHNSNYIIYKCFYSLNLEENINELIKMDNRLNQRFNMFKDVLTIVK